MSRFFIYVNKESFKATFLRQKLESKLITASYVEFIITSRITFHFKRH